jgi:hypothetical protein
MPIEIRMKRVSGKEYATVAHADCRDKEFNFVELGPIITNLQTKILGGNWLHKEALVINIFTRSCPNLTVVDLPGLTAAKAEGQPATMSKDIEKLVYSYMEKEETLILCVAQGNNDLANSPIEHARKFDKTGDRTIGVVTKMDLCLDDGTLQKDIVHQPRYPLKNGWVGVINRTDN